MSTIRAKINSNTSSGPQQVSVTVPSATAAQTLRSLNDVNVTTLEDGSILQYDASSEKFVSKTDISTTTGTLKLNGGNF